MSTRETSFAGTPRIDKQHTLSLFNRRFVGMSRDHYANTQGTWVYIKIRYAVQDMNQDATERH